MPDRFRSTSSQSTVVVDCQDGQRMDHSDGSFTITLPNVASVHCTRDGDIEGRTPAIRAVIITDLSKVVEHSIARLYDTISHTVHFEGGGVVSYLHGTDGTGYEFNCRNVVFEICETGEVLVIGTFVEE